MLEEGGTTEKGSEERELLFLGPVFGSLLGKKTCVKGQPAGKVRHYDFEAGS